MEKYNLIEETFITPMLVSKSWTDLGVNIGTSDLTAAMFQANRKQYPLYSGQTNGTPQIAKAVFDRRDRARIKSVRVRCNFADGLVLNSLSTTLGVGGNAATSFPWTTTRPDNVFDVYLYTYRIIEPSEMAETCGVVSFSLPSFEDFYTTDVFEGRDNTILDSNIIAPGYGPKIGPNLDRGFLLMPIVNMSTGMSFSTKSIDPLHQDGVCNIWLEAVIQHSYPVDINGSLV